MHQFQEEKDENVKSLMNKKSAQQVPRKKLVRNNFHEESLLHKKKNHCKNFMKRKIYS